MYVQLSIVLLTRPLSHHRAYAQGGQPRRRRCCEKSKPNRHDGDERGKVDDPDLAVARCDELGSSPTAYGAAYILGTVIHDR